MATDNFINVRELVPLLLKFKQDNPDKKIAFCFSGGGARGAYFGGVIEAIQQEINKHPQQTILPIEQRWKPDIICGTSAGALAGFAYWMECLLPSTPSPYACRQSNVWRSISDGNKGAEKLFDNPTVIDLLSKSSVELDNFLDSLDKLNDDLKPIFQNLDKQWNDIKLIISNSASFDINRFQNGIQDKVDSISNRVSKVGEKPKLKDALDWADNVLKLIAEVSSFIPAISLDLGNMQLDQAKKLVQNIKDLNNDIRDGQKNDMIKLVKDIRDFLYKLQDLYKKIRTTIFFSKFFIKTSSSLMNTNGLESVLEKFIFNSFPANTFQLKEGKIDARELDKAIVQLVQDKINAGKNVPALFLTGTNINAKRGVAFSLATPNVNESVANRNLWVIKLDEVGVDFSSHKIATNNEFVFGAKRFGTDFVHPTEIAQISQLPNSTDLINTILSGNVSINTETIAHSKNVIKTVPRTIKMASNSKALSKKVTTDRKSTRLNSSHLDLSRMPSSA